MNQNDIATFHIDALTQNPTGSNVFASREHVTESYHPVLDVTPYFRGDIDLDGTVNLNDFARFAGSWLDMNCADATPCGRADTDGDNDVDFNDLLELGQDWLL